LRDSNALKTRGHFTWASINRTIESATQELIQRDDRHNRMAVAIAIAPFQFQWLSL